MTYEKKISPFVCEDAPKEGEEGEEVEKKGEEEETEE